MKKKKPKSKRKLLTEVCEELWREIVYLRSKGVSEISGKPTEKGNRNAHHAWGKSTTALKFDTRGGINLDTNSEHLFGVHNNDPSIARSFQQRIEAKLIEREGPNILDILEMQKNHSGANLNMIEIALRHQLKKLKEGL